MMKWMAITVLMLHETRVTVLIPCSCYANFQLLFLSSYLHLRLSVCFLQEGAWCESEAACKVRARAHLGSSKWMNDRTFEGILSNSEEVNPGLNLYF